MEQNHIIHKVVIDISVSNKEKAYEIKDNINSFLTIEVFPRLEKQFNAIQSIIANQTLQIPQLTIHLDESESSLNAALKDKIIESLEKELSETIKPILNSDPEIKKDSKINLLPEEERLVQTFIYFLEKGYMPWWSSNEKAITILEPSVFKKIVSAKNFVPEVVSCIQEPKVRERIINQLNDAQIRQTCLAILKYKNIRIDLESNIIKKLSKQSFADRKAIWTLVLNVLAASFNVSDMNLQEYAFQQILKAIPFFKTAESKGSEKLALKDIASIFLFMEQNQEFNARIKNINPEKELVKKQTGKDMENQQNKSKETDAKQADFQPLKSEINKHEPKIPDENGYHVQNAGLVLIHPFINNFFKHCGLINPETKNISDPELCVHLLHYIATGKKNQPESSMLFEKFLCNIPLSQSINRHIKLSRKHKTEAAKVIEAVKQNWSSMKTASDELLQNEFFQRPGKLVINEDQTLTVERKAHDIFLDKLSWGIGFIKLPWQNQFIYVNW